MKVLKTELDFLWLIYYTSNVMVGCSAHLSNEYISIFYVFYDACHKYCGLWENVPIRNVERNMLTRFNACVFTCVFQLFVTFAIANIPYNFVECQDNCFSFCIRICILCKFKENRCRAVTLSSHLQLTRCCWMKSNLLDEFQKEFSSKS